MGVNIISPRPGWKCELLVEPHVPEDKLKVNNLSSEIRQKSSKIRKVSVIESALNKFWALWLKQKSASYLRKDFIFALSLFLTQWTLPVILIVC